MAIPAFSWVAAKFGVKDLAAGSAIMLALWYALPSLFFRLLAGTGITMVVWKGGEALAAKVVTHLRAAFEGGTGSQIAALWEIAGLTDYISITLGGAIAAVTLRSLRFSFRRG